MKLFLHLIFILMFGIVGCSATKEINYSSIQGEKWRAVHLLNYTSDSSLADLGELIPELKKMGINVVVLEVDYSFEFQSHPELRQGTNPITFNAARNFAKICRTNNIKLITEFQCVGHQSWAEQTFPLLTKYPELDLTPGAFPGNKDIYCREWDVTNPEVYNIVFDLLDEIIDAFQVEAFHVGMDEIFLLGSESSPSTYGKDPGKLFAKAINDIHDHLVKKRGLEMLMWSDRLFDGTNFNFGEWESSLNGTATAIDMIPKDIILCAWHYEKMDSYPSIPIFIEKGFRVLPASWKDVDAAKTLIEYSYKESNPQMLGHFFTIWSRRDLLNYPPIVECRKILDVVEK